MNRVVAAFTVAVLALVLPGCSKEKPAISHSSNECSPPLTMPEEGLDLDIKIIANLLAPPAIKTVPAPPAAWDKTEDGVHQFVRSTVESICAMLSEVFAKAQLGGLWKLYFAVGQPGQTFETCNKALGNLPLICRGALGADGFYHAWSVIYPYTQLRDYLTHENAILVTGQIAMRFMDIAFGATDTRLNNNDLAACGAGVWQGTLVAQGQRSAGTNNDFAKGAVLTDATKQGIAHRSLGQCIKDFWLRTSEGSPSPTGALRGYHRTKFLGYFYIVHLYSYKKI